MGDAREEAHEMYTELMNALWEQFKKAKEKALKGDPKNKEELFEDFKKENAELIKQVKDSLPDGKDSITKDFILDQSTKNMSEYGMRYDESNKRTMEMIEEMKKNINPDTKDGQELLDKLKELEKSNLDKLNDKNELIDSLNSKYIERTPYNESIVEHIKNDDVLKGFDFNKVDQDRLVFTNKDEHNLYGKVDVENKEISIIKEFTKYREDRAYKTEESIKNISFKDINSSSKLNESHVEKNGGWVKKEMLNKKENTKEGKEGKSNNTKESTNEKEHENTKGNKKEKSVEKEFEYEME